MDRIRLGIFSANLNSANMGCNALTYSALLLLNEIAQKQGKAFSYKLFCKDAKECLLHYECLAGMDIRFIEPIVRNRDKIKALLKRKFSLLSDFKWGIDECDLFFEIAGGDSYSDLYGIMRPVLFDKCHSMVMKKRSPLIFLPQTIGPFKSKKAKLIATHGLSYATHIFTRDPISYQKAMEFSKPNLISQTIDMAFFMDYEKCEKRGTKLKIGINPSGLLWNRGYQGNNEFGLKVDYRDLIVSLIGSIDVKKYDIALVPHVLHGPEYRIEDDYKVCIYLKKKFPYCKIAPFFYTPMDAKSYISGLDFLIGSRMHCCIAAYSTGVPVYPLAYSRKFKGLFKEELDYPFGAELVSDDVESISNNINNLLRNLDHIQLEMLSRVKKINKYKRYFIDSLSEIISASTSK